MYPWVMVGTYFTDLLVDVTCTLPACEAEDYTQKGLNFILG
jgi:hypothetical protein